MSRIKALVLVFMLMLGHTELSLIAKVSVLLRVWLLISLGLHHVSLDVFYEACH